ncbi:MAG: SH3 domain-containing protein, partial [Ignavibacteriae bacterium]|nr:SH3 domain-containing protein [Ignavibacteriota bacterium]
SSFYKMKKYMGDIYLHILQVLKKRKKILFISLITIIFSIALIGTIIFSYNQYYSYINSKPIISSNCNIEDLVCRVAQTDGTDMRNAPSHNSKIEKRLVENAILEILADDGPPETIDSQTFSWYKVKDSEKVGWVHAQYLQRLK